MNPQPFVAKRICIHTHPQTMWKYLTQLDCMKKRMLDDETAIDTTWEVGSSIQIRGNLQGVAFENNGEIKVYEPYTLLAYTHLSSLSQLPDNEENHCQLQFRLSAVNSQICLQLTISNFPTVSIYRYLNFLLAKYTDGITKHNRDTVSRIVSLPEKKASLIQ